MARACDGFFDEVERRLTALAQRRAFRFRATPRAAAAAHLEGLSRVAGAPAERVAAAAATRGWRFTEMMAGYFERLGAARGALFRGSDIADIDTLEDFRRRAARLLAKSGGPALPETAAVFRLHQGYQFSFQPAEGGADAPVFTYVEGDPDWRETARSLQADIEGELRLMEEVVEMQRELGGYWVTLPPEGGVREVHPAQSERPRPIESADRYLD